MGPFNIITWILYRNGIELNNFDLFKVIFLKNINPKATLMQVTVVYEIEINKRNNKKLDPKDPIKVERVQAVG